MFLHKDYLQTTLVGVVFIFASQLIVPILSPYIKGLGFSDIELSLIFSLYPLAIILLTPYFCEISDKIGRKSIIRLGIAIQMCAFMFYIYGTNHLVLIVLARVFNAIAFTTVSLIALSKIQDVLDDTSRGRFAGIFLSVQKFGQIVAPVIGGFIADYYFIQVPFFMGITIMATLLAFLFIHAHDKKFSTADLRYAGISSIRQFLSYRELKGLAIMGVAIHAWVAGYLVFMPLYIINTLGMTYKAVGMAYLVFGIGSLFQFIYGNLSDRFGRARILIGGTLLKGVMWMFVAFSADYWFLLGFLLIAGIGSGMWKVTALSLLSDIGERIKREGSFVASYMSLAKLGGFISFLLAGFIVQYFSISILFMINASLIITGSIIAWFFMKGH